MIINKNFHEKCIKSWLKKADTYSCPVCRFEIKKTQTNQINTQPVFYTNDVRGYSDKDSDYSNNSDYY